MRTRVGLSYMLASSGLFAIMGVCAYSASLISPETSSLLTSFVRMLINLFIIIGFAAAMGNPELLWGDRRLSLFLRGAFGAVGVMFSFAAIKAIGIGDSAFLHASNGFFIAFLSPFILSQRNSVLGWAAVVGGMIGLFFLFDPRVGDLDPLGRTYGLMSGVFSAFAYLMVARAGRTNHAITVIFYHCFISTLAHLAIFPFVELKASAAPQFWAYLVLAGFSGTAAQYFMTKAYRYAPATLNAAVSYTNPVLNMLLGVIIFAQFPDQKGLIGATIVLLSGIVLPYAASKKASPTEQHSKRG